MGDKRVEVKAKGHIALLNEDGTVEIWRGDRVDAVLIQAGSDIPVCIGVGRWNADRGVIEGCDSIPIADTLSIELVKAVGDVRGFSQ